MPAVKEALVRRTKFPDDIRWATKRPQPWDYGQGRQPKVVFFRSETLGGSTGSCDSTPIPLYRSKARRRGAAWTIRDLPWPPACDVEALGTGMRHRRRFESSRRKTFLPKKSPRRAGRGKKEASSRSGKGLILALSVA